jgi:hypothetical protein
MNKFDHVKNTPRSRKHRCFWPGCQTEVPVSMLGCKNHWYRLPKPLRDRIWATYQPGQETDGSQSPQYMEALQEVMRYAQEHAV